MAKKPEEQVKKELAPAKGDHLPSLNLNFDADIGAGMETADKDSFAIPFLGVLQKISPQCEESDPKYIEGAKAGMLFNSVTQQLYDGKEGLIFLQCAYQRRFLHWGPRGGDGAGFKGALLPEDAVLMKEGGQVVEVDGRLLFPMADGKLDPKKCAHLADTRSHFGMIYDEATGEAVSCILPLASTQIKKSKQLMAMLSAVKVKGGNGNMVTPPTWVNKIRITTVLESNDKGSWYGIKITPEGFINDQDAYDAGKKFHDLIAEGDVTVNYAQADGGDAAEGAEKF